MMRSQQQNLKLILITAIGTMLEWAEYTFYGYLALKLSGLFFPQQDAMIAVIKTYAIFAIGYVMRPLGAILFGALGDQYGRKPALILSMLLMGLATFAIGCLPTYQSWGQAAPICLLLLRMLQGIAVSGEFNGAGIFLIEKIGQKNPCLAGSWVSSAAAGGMVLGGLAAFIVTLPAMPEWSWRIPFLIGGTSCLVALWFRRDITESKPFLTQPKQRSSIRNFFVSTLSLYKHSFFYVAAMAAFTGIYVYILNVYVVAFLIHHADVPSHHAALFAMFGETLVCIFIPVMARLADAWHAEKQYLTSLMLIACLSPVLFAWLLTGTYGYITAAMVVYGLLNALMCGPMVKLLVDQYPIRARYTGISFAWSFSAAIFSGTAPMIAQFLTGSMGWMMGPGYYVSAMALLAVAVILLTKARAFQHAACLSIQGQTK